MDYYLGSKNIIWISKSGEVSLHYLGFVIDKKNIFIKDIEIIV